MHRVRTEERHAGGVPGVGRWVGGWRGYTRYPVPTLQDPYLVIFEPQDPTHGRMKAILRYLMRFLRPGPDKGLELTRIDLRIDLQLTSQTGPQMPSDLRYPGPQISHGPE